jgi:hypothetical protein
VVYSLDVAVGVDDVFQLRLAIIRLIFFILPLNFILFTTHIPLNRPIRNPYKPPKPTRLLHRLHLQQYHPTPLHQMPLLKGQHRRKHSLYVRHYVPLNVFAASPEAVVVLRHHIAVGGAVHFELFDVFGLEGDLEVV